MYKIKQVPEDFIVKEINEVKIEDNGKYAYFILKKKNYNTSKAIDIIIDVLHADKKNVQFAGNKDKNALTEQLISIKNGNKNMENVVLKDIELKYLGNGHEEIYLGNLDGNKFEITLRNLENKDITSLKKKIDGKEVLMPNYFGQQRFSTKNKEIGKSIIKKDFKESIKLILETDSDCEGLIKKHLEKSNNDFVGALKIIPPRLLKLYVHSYQSYLFNKTLEGYPKKNKTDHNIEIPLIGFGTEIKTDEIRKMMEKLMEEEQITERDFIIRQIPYLSCEGEGRKGFVKVNDFEILKEEKDELNESKEKMIVKFSLPKGSYATVLIEILFKN
ncbi:tRNA pseudouridine(13) synthase TruD [Candidatus Woesearchaeota archaeon]|nr:tRNA pseudouridine(13) synthase TruD [Candidatus Woesearchaeota archaeon]